MSEVAMGSRTRWAVAAMSATAIVAALLVLFRLPPPPVALPAPSTSSTPASTVKIARPDETDLLLKEQAELRDLRPLFLPTEHNAALPEPRLEPGRTFLDNENLKLKFADAEVQVSRDLPVVVTINGKPLHDAQPRDALAADAERPTLLGFGRGPATIEALPPRGGWVEVVTTRDGENVLAQALPVEARPPGNKAWAPVELLAVVDPAGLASPLVVVQGSRVEEVDAHFRNFLARTFRIGDRLAPGFYRITVTP